jgi:hypothetical protein
MLRQLKSWERRVLEGDFTAIPDPFLWRESAHLAHFIDGYAEAGGIERLGDLANPRKHAAIQKGIWEGSAKELWLCLFFEHRRYHHFGRSPEGHELVVLNRLCASLGQAVQTLGPAEARALASRFKRQPNEPGLAGSDDSQGPVQEINVAKIKRAAILSVRRNVDYTFFGQRRYASSAIEALIDILIKLAAGNCEFFLALSKKVKSTSRNYIAAFKEDVYQNEPELIGDTTEIVPGWWLGTNLANTEKMHILKKACEEAGLEFGKDLIIFLPNVS